MWFYFSTHPELSLTGMLVISLSSFQKKWIMLFSLHWKYLFSLLENRVYLLVQPQILEEQCSCGKLDQFFICSRILKGVWELAHPVCMCFVDLEKAQPCLYPCPVLLYNMAIWTLYNNIKSLVCITPQVRFILWWVLDSASAAIGH